MGRIGAVVAENFCFYLLAIIMILSSLGIILASKMFFAVLAFWILTIISSLMFNFLGAHFLAISQFILYGVLLVGYIILLLKKIDKFNLPLKLVAKPKIVTCLIFVLLFGMLTVSFFLIEVDNSVFELFNFAQSTFVDKVSFFKNAFSLHLLLILLFVGIVVVRVLLNSQNYNNIAEDCSVVQIKDIKND